MCSIHSGVFAQERADYLSSFWNAGITGNAFVDGSRGGLGFATGGYLKLGNSPFFAGGRFRFASTVSGAPELDRTDYGGDLDLQYYFPLRSWDGPRPYVLAGISGNHVDVIANLDGYSIRQNGFRFGAHGGLGFRVGRFFVEGQYRYLNHWLDYSPSLAEFTAGLAIPFGVSPIGSSSRSEAATFPIAVQHEDSLVRDLRLDSFHYSGPDTFAWICDATPVALQGFLKKANFDFAGPGERYRFRVTGSMITTENMLTMSAQILSRETLVSELTVTSDLRKPFDAWGQLATGITRAAFGLQ